ncbi:MAG: hypothetical protein Q7U48_13725 [Hydrogenophaga sp.]|nr:hypothetical protein [Hydrogenophaga sp.]
MREPIKAGDLAEVINGLLGKDSPNLGLIVRVRQYLGDEKTLGRIWRCEAEYAQTLKLHNAPTPAGMADFAQSWLRKIEPDAPPAEAEKTKEGLSA